MVKLASNYYDTARACRHQGTIMTVKIVEMVSTKGSCSKVAFQKFSLFSIGNISEVSIHVQAKICQVLQSLKRNTCNSTEVDYWLKLRQSCACSSRQWTEFWVRKLVDFQNSVAVRFLDKKRL